LQHGLIMTKQWQQTLGTTFAGIAGGLLFFVAAVAFTLGMAMLNARLTPAVPWFSLPVLLTLGLVIYWIDRRWDIGLALPARPRWWPIVLFAVAAMIACRCLSILEGAWHGVTRSFEVAPFEVTPFFAVVYWLTVVIALSTASETGFRGIMQSRLTPLFGVWPAILIVTFVNGISHRWDGLYERMIAVAAILIAWGYIRHLSGSLTPAILTHVGLIMIWDASLWYFGPLDLSTLGPEALTMTAITGLLAFAVALWAASVARRDMMSGSVQ